MLLDAPGKPLLAALLDPTDLPSLTVWDQDDLVHICPTDKPTRLVPVTEYSLAPCAACAKTGVPDEVFSFVRDLVHSRRELDTASTFLRTLLSLESSFASVEDTAPLPRLVALAPLFKPTADLAADTRSLPAEGALGLVRAAFARRTSVLAASLAEAASAPGLQEEISSLLTSSPSALLAFLSSPLPDLEAAWSDLTESAATLSGVLVASPRFAIELTPFLLPFTSALPSPAPETTSLVTGPAPVLALAALASPFFPSSLASLAPFSSALPLSSTPPDTLPLLASLWDPEDPSASPTGLAEMAALLS